jgi:hypothetical protein
VPAPHLPTPRRGIGLVVAVAGIVLACAAAAAAWYYEPRLKALFGAADPRPSAAGGTPVVVAAAPGEAPAPPAAPPGGFVASPGPLAGLAAVPPSAGPADAPPLPALPPSPPRSMTQAPPPRPVPPPPPAARMLNLAGETITRLFVARAQDGVGREDWLGQAQITPGNAVLLRAPAGQGCLFNIRVVYVGGRTEDRPGVDLCAAPELRFEGSKGAGSSPR